MAGKVYLTEEAYRTAILRRNETSKVLSALFIQAGSAWAIGGFVQVYTKRWGDDPYVGWWFLGAILLIAVGLALLRRLESES